jgi:hypothetical protein
VCVSACTDSNIRNSPIEDNCNSTDPYLYFEIATHRTRRSGRFRTSLDEMIDPDPLNLSAFCETRHDPTQ